MLENIGEVLYYGKLLGWNKHSGPVQMAEVSGGKSVGCNPISEH